MRKLIALVLLPLLSLALFAAKPPYDPTTATDISGTEPKKVAIDAFSLPGDLDMTVWATTPMFFNPTNMDTDAAGRIWVAEGVNYRKHETRRPEGDRIMVLEDSDGDGQADKSHCFVQEAGLIAPLGLSVFDNQVVVAQPPAILVYTDVNRDLVFDPAVDKREELLTGFNAKNHDHSLHTIVAGPDGKWYFNQGNCGANVTDADGKTFRLGGTYFKSGAGNPIWFNNPLEYGGEASDDGKVWLAGAMGRMNPDGSGLEIVGHGFRNSYEACLSSFGDVFQNDNDDMVSCRNTWLMEGGFLAYFSKDGKRTWKADRRPGQDTPQAHWHQEDPGVLPAGDIYGSGSPTGMCFYENGALPAKYAGTLFSCEARQRIVFGYQPKVGDGAAVELGERTDFLASRDNDLFRPSDVMVGADGALYVSDWFDNRVGGHADNDESMSGTIYRIAPKGFEPSIAKPTGDALKDAIAMLKSPASHVRYAGFKQLVKAGEAALPVVQALLEEADPFVAARAVWLLPLLGEEGKALVRRQLEDEEAERRLLAFRALRNAGEDVVALAETLVDDGNAAVRREVAVALRAVPGDAKRSLVTKLFSKIENADDRHYVEACGLAAEGIEDEVWAALSVEDSEALTWTPAMARSAWRLQPEAAVPALIERVKAESLNDEARRLAFDSLAFIGNREAVMFIVDLAAEGEGALAEQATWWLFNRGLDDWEPFGTRALLKERGIYDPDTIVLQAVQAPPKTTKSNLPPAAEIAQMDGDSVRGKAQAARCIMCHQFEGLGVEFGPDLTGWVKDQGVEAFVTALVLPSDSIAHGYELTHIELKDGMVIDGVARSLSDPVLIESMGGLKQRVPRDRIKSMRERRWDSLMMSAEQLGLTAQDIADIAAYLETL